MASELFMILSLLHVSINILQRVKTLFEISLQRNKHDATSFHERLNRACKRLDPIYMKVNFINVKICIIRKQDNTLLNNHNISLAMTVFILSHNI